MNPIQIKINFIQYSNLNDLVRVFEKIPQTISNKEFLKKKSKIINSNYTVKTTLKILKKRGCFGFFIKYKDKNKDKEIHYWYSKKISFIKLIELMAHELAHSIGIYSEKEASKYGMIASAAANVIKNMKIKL